MSDQNTTVSILPNRKTAKIFFRVWTLLVLAGIVGGMLAASTLSNQISISGLLVIGINIVAIMAVLTARLHVRRILDTTGPLLVFSPAGFHDVRISLEPIPWTAIQWRTLRTKAGSVQVEVDPNFRGKMYLTLPERFGHWCFRLIGYPSFTVSPFATDHTIDELEVHFMKFKAPVN